MDAGESGGYTDPMTDDEQAILRRAAEGPNDENANLLSEDRQLSCEAQLVKNDLCSD